VQILVKVRLVKRRKAKLTYERDEILSVYSCLLDNFLCSSQRNGAVEKILAPDPRAIHCQTLNVYWIKHTLVHYNKAHIGQ